MFPSMDKNRAFGALKTFHELLIAKRGKRGKDILFAINRFDRKLDRLGTGYGKYYTNLTFTNVLNFCSYSNDLFVFCNRVMRQKRGLAIGGTDSAQLASITLSVAKELYYPCVTPVPLDPTGHHPCDLPVHPARFRENVIGLKRVSTPLSDIKANLEAMYALDLQVESERNTLKTLEGLLSMESFNFRLYLRISRPPRTDTTTPIEHAKLRDPSVYAAGARRVVQSLVPAEVKKDLHYRENPHDAMMNTLETISKPRVTATWWEPLLWDRI